MIIRLSKDMFHLYLQGETQWVVQNRKFKLRHYQSVSRMIHEDVLQTRTDTKQGGHARAWVLVRRFASFPGHAGVSHERAERICMNGDLICETPNMSHVDISPPPVPNPDVSHSRSLPSQSDSVLEAAEDT